MAPFSLLIVSVAALASGLILVLLVRRWLFQPERMPLPPGPKGYPIIGNLFDMPKECGWLEFSKWQRTYGDMIYVTILNQPFLIINSHKIAADLLEKRSTYYSARMRFTFGGELVGHNRSIGLQEGDTHRQARKFAHRSLNSSAVKQWQGMQEAEAHKTLKNLLQSPANFVKHFYLNSGNTIMRIGYGYEAKDHDDTLFRRGHIAISDFSKACAPGRWMVDFLPMLKHVPEWVPGAQFQKNARKWRADLEQCYSFPFRMVKAQMQAGTAAPSMTAQLLETKKPETDERHIADAVGTLFIAGVDTTPSALSSFILAMMLYPNMQRRAQDELGHVVGVERLPTFADGCNLPYTIAIVKEVLRWLPLVPLALPHRLVKEDEYQGYRIPKDTIVITNIWHMNRDSSLYGAETDTFRPERFLGPNPAPHGFSTSNTVEFGSPVFGFGRRVCPGQHLAFQSLFILCANILATMDISPVLDVDGQPILPEAKLTDGVIAHPVPFRCNITPRSVKAVELIDGTS